MTIRISCPCGKPLTFPDQQAGKMAPCPSCGRIHMLDRRAAQEPAPPAPPAEPRPAFQPSLQAEPPVVTPVGDQRKAPAAVPTVRPEKPTPASQATPCRQCGKAFPPDELMKLKGEMVCKPCYRRSFLEKTPPKRSSGLVPLYLGMGAVWLVAAVLAAMHFGLIPEAFPLKKQAAPRVPVAARSQASPQWQPMSPAPTPIVRAPAPQAPPQWQPPSPPSPAPSPAAPPTSWSPSASQQTPKTGEDQKDLPPAEPKPGDSPTEKMSVQLARGAKMDFALISSGSFDMGSEKSADEKPVHTVRLTRPFYMAVYEVTQAQWKAVMGDNPSSFKGDDLPVENVSWEDCRRFLAKLREKVGEGRACRLPTEAEWEYACRAGSKTDYCFGDGEGGLDEYAWYSGNSQSKTHPVGQKKTNAWGLYDMHGNVWEWCQDGYDKEYYGKSAGEDPQGPPAGTVGLLRGGSWGSYGVFARSANRDGRARSSRHANFGLRVVVSAPE